MPISSVSSSVSTVSDGTGYNSQLSAEPQKNAQAVGQTSSEKEVAGRQNVDTAKKEKKIDKKDLTPVTEAMNKFMEIMNANLEFSVHEKTHRLMVRLVDVKTNTILKEFPPHEFLDTIAKIQAYVGAILDKKA